MRLRSHLLAWLLPPLLLLWVVALQMQAVRIETAADAAHDRALLGSATAIAERTVLRDGRIVAELPAAALTMLELQAQERVFYEIVCLASGTRQTGSDTLPAGPPPQGSAPRYWDAQHGGSALRMVALPHRIDGPAPCNDLLVRVGETTLARDALARQLLTDAAAVQFGLIVLAAALIWFGVRRGLLPLKRLRDEIRARHDEQLAPVETRGVPREIVPLVEAFNLQLARQRCALESQRRFVADASHQLKTPLAVLRTQAEIALRQPDLERTRSLVKDLADVTESTARMVHQLLALLRSDALASEGDAPVDLVETAREATFGLLPLALARGTELSFAGDDRPLPVRAHGLLLHELVANLVDNAIRYTPPGGRIEVRAHRHAGGAEIVVTDNGPGIAADERERSFQRFYRTPGTGGDGCGLGLAIVRQIAERYRARVVLDEAPGGGLVAAVVFPLPGA